VKKHPVAIMEVSIVTGYPFIAGWFFSWNIPNLNSWMITRANPHDLSGKPPSKKWEWSPAFLGPRGINLATFDVWG